MTRYWRFKKTPKTINIVTINQLGRVNNILERTFSPTNRGRFNVDNKKDTIKARINNMTTLNHDDAT